MRKGVAVPYVIALILGVAVIALLGIWFVTTGGKFSTESASTLCRSKALEFCTRFLGSDHTVANWDTVRGSLTCDLGKIGIKHATENRPDCTKVIT